MKTKWLRTLLVLTLAVSLPFNAMAQNAATPAPAPAGPQLLKPQELDALVAPIALYPDPLLSEVLMASVYPLDIVQAERWLEDNKNLKGDELKAAVDKQPWDQSVKALVATPDVLAMMNSKLDWTQKLGDAVVAQQSDVMDAVQRLRERAQTNNKLVSTTQQKVSVQQVEGRQVIAIEPTDPDTLYVPYYDPGVVYGDWPYSDYPPYYFPVPGYIGAGIIATGIAFGAGYALGRWVSGGNRWGGNINWGNRNIVSNRPINGGRGANWRPSVEHRQNAGNRLGSQQRQQIRNGVGNQAGRPGSAGRQETKPSGGNRVEHRGKGPGGGRQGTKPSGGNRVEHRGKGPSTGGGRNKTPSAKTRPSGGNRATTRQGGGGQAPRARTHAGHPGGAGVQARGGGHVGGGGRGGGGRGGGGRRSDMRLKHDIVLLGYLNGGLGFYRFTYNGGHMVYVGVMAQEVRQVMPHAVSQDTDGFLRADYTKLGLKFETYRQWLESGARIPHAVGIAH